MDANEDVEREPVDAGASPDAHVPHQGPGFPGPLAHHEVIPGILDQLSPVDIAGIVYSYAKELQVMSFEPEKGKIRLDSRKAIAFASDLFVVSYDIFMLGTTLRDACIHRELDGRDLFAMSCQHFLVGPPAAP